MILCVVNERVAVMCTALSKQINSLVLQVEAHTVGSDADVIFVEEDEEAAQLRSIHCTTESDERGPVPLSSISGSVRTRFLVQSGLCSDHTYASYPYVGILWV